jgi:hypothetical protein
MDLVTVTHARDKTAMLRQARSINKFVTGNVTHWVIIQDDTITAQEWLDLLTPIYTQHTLKILTNDIEIFNKIGGWIQQQILKLTVATKIDADEYLILDTKNFFIKETCLTDWPVKEGNGVCLPTEHFINPTSFNVWLPWISRLSFTLNKPIPSMLPDPITPFRVKTSTVRQILKDIDVSKFFQTYRRDPSEFLLYAFYCDTLVRIPVLPSITAWQGSISKTELKIIDDNPMIKLFAIHRDFDDNESIDIVNNWCKSLNID